MLLQPKPSLTFDDWLANERAAIEGRSEYIDGEVFAMTGAREQHNLIVTNLIGELHPQMKGRPCRIYANDMKVRIRAANAGTYPDLVALCGEHEFLDERRVGGREGVGGRFRAPADEAHPSPLDTLHSAPGELPEADLRTGKVDKHPHGTDQLVGHPPDAVEGRLVFRHRAVRHVEAEDIDASLDEAADRLLRRGCRAERRDDLRADELRISAVPPRRAGLGRSAGIPGWIGRGGGHGALRRKEREGKGRGDGVWGESLPREPAGANQGRIRRPALDD